MGIRTAVLKDELGIMAYAFENMGFEIVAFYERNKKAADMCRHNLESRCIYTDLLEGSETEIPDVELIIAQLPHHIFESMADMGYHVSYQL